MKWRERLAMDPSLRDIQSWPLIDSGTLPRQYRQRFTRNRAIIARVITGVSIKSVAHDFHVSTNFVSRLATRALAGESPALTEGLIPYKRVHRHQRRAPLASLDASSGSQNAFQHLLNSIPGMRDQLDRMLSLRLKDKPNAQVQSVAAFFGEFKRLLLAAQWPTDCYPYTTSSFAYESIRRYYHARLGALRLQLMKKPNREIVTRTPIYRALKSIQIDAQRTDVNTSIHIQLDQEVAPLRISRATLIKAIDVHTHCILGYTLVLSKDPNQDDLLSLFDTMSQQWQPMTLATPGLAYFPGSGFPSMWGDHFLHTAFDEVNLDNALIHLAETVRQHVCDQMGATLNLGLPKMPKGRNLIESAFAMANRRATHRLPSTTGSHPHDPIKESTKNYKKPPVISLRMLEEILSVIIAEHNARPRAELNNETPLHAFQRQINEHYVRFRPEYYHTSISPFESEKVCSVIFLTKEKRRPFIRFAHLRYQGNCLDNPHLLYQKVRIRYDRRDVRAVLAYTLGGQYLGELYAPKSWMRFAHSLSTRRIIIKAMKEWRYHSPDILAEFFHQLSLQKETPSAALELVRITREAQRIVPVIGALADQKWQSGESTSSQIENAVNEPPPTLEKPPIPPTHSIQQPSPIAPWKSDWASQSGE